MNSKSSMLIFFIYILSQNFSSAAADSVRSNLVAESVKSAIDSNSYISIQSSVEEYCGINNYFDSKANMTIYQRKYVLDAVSFCLESAKAAAASSALSKNNLNVKFAAEEAIKPAMNKVKNEEGENQSEIDFMGISWGIGFGYSFSDDEAIDDAEIVDGIVRVKSNKKEQPRVLLEFHKYLWCNKGAKFGVRGCGPFVAVAATQDELLSGVGMGFMYGFKANPSDSEGFSIGIGAILDADVKDLADGFKENSAAPSGETAIRYKSESRWSALIFVTRTF
jgi:hypothetical protein